MITRGSVKRNHTSPKPMMVGTHGLVRTTMHNGIVHTWAIARPVSSWEVTTVNPPLLRGGQLPLTLSAPHLEMDPSNIATWQRQYSF